MTRSQKYPRFKFWEPQEKEKASFGKVVQSSSIIRVACASGRGYLLNLRNLDDATVSSKEVKSHIIMWIISSIWREGGPISAGRRPKGEIWQHEAIAVRKGLNRAHSDVQCKSCSLVIKNGQTRNKLPHAIACLKVNFEEKEKWIALIKKERRSALSWKIIWLDHRLVGVKAPAKLCRRLLPSIYSRFQA